MGGDSCEFTQTKPFQIFIRANECMPVSKEKHAIDKEIFYAC